MNREVCRAAWRSAWRYTEGCMEVHGGGGEKILKKTETIDLVGDNREFEV